jgi:large subunit ribosomal protein L13
MKTSTPKATAPTWYIVDATDQSIGRMSSRIAHVLRGKHKPTFSAHQMCGDVVIVINADKMAVSPEKGRRKTYYKHSGMLGHIKSATLTEMMERDARKVIELAVYGMLPRNRQREDILHRLHVFNDDKHKYAAQKPQVLDISKLL